MLQEKWAAFGSLVESTRLPRQIELTPAKRCILTLQVRVTSDASTVLFQDSLARRPVDSFAIMTARVLHMPRQIHDRATAPVESTQRLHVANRPWCESDRETNEIARCLGAMRLVA